MNKIIYFINSINHKIKELNSTFLTRYNANRFKKYKLDFTNILFSSLLTLNNSSIEQVTGILEEEYITSVSKTAIVKRRNCVKTYKYIDMLNNHMIQEIYNPKNKFINEYSFQIYKNDTWFTEVPYNKRDKSLFINNTSYRFIGCDCCQLNVLKDAVNNDNIKISSSKNYGVILISSLFDIINNIPINYHSVHSNTDNFNKKKVNETTGLLAQFNKLNNNDIIVMDRWYYSKKLHLQFIKNNIGYIFRVKDNSLLFRNIGYGKSKIVQLNGETVQLFKYKIKKNQYNILTSITNKINIQEIKALYWKRWKIETDNKKFKYDILSANIRSKNNTTIQLDIECIKFMSIISSVIEFLGKEKLKTNTKFNSKNCIGALYRKLLRFILYESTNYKEICRLVGIIYKKIIPIINGRSNKRIRISPSTKWNVYGNRYGNKNK